MSMTRIRLCHFGDKFDNSQPKPSGSYMQLATTAKIPYKKWQCQCNMPIQDHILDWYGRHQTQADWRRKISNKFTKEVCKVLNLQATKPTAVHAIQDDMAPPFPITNPSSTTTLPTDARIRQKERLTKLKEAGLKPNKKPKFTEPGTDDCGDDISGLGPEAIMLSNDVIWETADFSDEEPQEVYPTTGTTTEDLRVPTTEDYRERFNTPWSSRLPSGGMGCPACHNSLRKIGRASCRERV